MRSGGVVRCGAARNGARCYLAVRGGFDVPLVMGSASVHVMTRVGGRPLRRREIAWRAARAAVRKPRGPARGAPGCTTGLLRCGRRPVRKPRGSARSCTAAEIAMVSEEANRMGIRLKGAAVRAPERSHSDLRKACRWAPCRLRRTGSRSNPLRGSIQTTGGYPKPANVISADFWRLGAIASARPGELREDYAGRGVESAARAESGWRTRYDAGSELRHGRVGRCGA